MKRTKNGKEHVLGHMLGAGISGCITECIVLPVDTIKTRLMIDASAPVSIKALKNATSTLWAEGGSAFFRGLTPGLHRQIVFASTRIGLYDPVRFARQGG